MSNNLLYAGFTVAGYDVAGARSPASPAWAGGLRSVGEVAAEADIIITCLPSMAALREVVREFKQAPRWGQIVVTAA
jgi:L-threonate 2-dehydrogenase